MVFNPKRNLTTWTLSLSHAMCNNVFPALSVALMLAPLSLRIFRVLVALAEAAKKLTGAESTPNLSLRNLLPPPTPRMYVRMAGESMADAMESVLGDSLINFEANTRLRHRGFNLIKLLKEETSSFSRTPKSSWLRARVKR